MLSTCNQAPKAARDGNSNEAACIDLPGLSAHKGKPSVTSEELKQLQRDLDKEMEAILKCVPHLSPGKLSLAYCLHVGID